LIALALNNIHLDIVLSVADEAVAAEIVNEASKGLVSWQDLVEKYKGKGISLYRLRKIILVLLSSRKIVELPCRLFTTYEYLEKTPKDLLRKEIEDKIRSIGLQKCGKPIGVPYERISISISRNRKIIVSFYY
jgi:hypothetical protein